MSEKSTKSLPSADLKYTLSELLDVGLKILQVPFADLLHIKTVPVDASEKEERMARQTRHVSKEEKKREERHMRNEGKDLKDEHAECGMRQSQKTEQPEKLILRLSDKTADTSKDALQQLSNPDLAHQLAMQQLVAQRAKSMSISKRTSSTSDVKKVLSLSDNIADEPSVFKFGSKESLYDPNTYDSWEWAMPQPAHSQFFDDGSYRTVMLRNIPNKYSRKDLLRRLHMRFKGEFDFLYIPFDFTNECNVGYAFINLKYPESVPRFIEHFNGVRSSICLPDHSSSKVCQVTPAHVQGLQANVEHLRTGAIATQLRNKPQWQPYIFDARGNVKPFPWNHDGEHITEDDLAEEFEPVEKDTKKEDKIEKDSYARKEKLRKEKNKRSATEGTKLEPCTVNFDIHSTAMVRYIPENLTRCMLNIRLRELFPVGTYDFLYMPVDFEKNNNVGYFFINFRDNDALKTCIDIFHNAIARDVFPDSQCDDYIEVSPARVQGLETNIANLKNSSVGMVGRSNLEWKPLLFGEDGAFEELDLAPMDTKQTFGRIKSKKSESLTKPKKYDPSSIVTDYGSFKTAIIRNIPLDLNRIALQERLDAIGLKNKYDLIYVPMDYDEVDNAGHAIVNFRTNDSVHEFYMYFQGIDSAVAFPDFSHTSIIEVTPSPVQGLEANVRHMQATYTHSLEAVDTHPFVLDERQRRLAYPWIEIAPKLSWPGYGLDDRQWLAMDYMYRHSGYSLYRNSGSPLTDGSPSPVDPLLHRTLMIRNIPNKFTRDKLLARVQELSPPQSINFFYMPINFTNTCNVGYCFVNFTTMQAVQQCVENFDNVDSSVCLPGFMSSKVCQVTPARIQGVHANVAHLQHSMVLEALVKLDLIDWAPLLFDKQGNEQPFPGLAVSKTSVPSEKKKKKSVVSATTTTTKETSSMSATVLSMDSGLDTFSLFYGQVLPFVDPIRGGYTTIMIRNIGSKVRKQHLVAELGRAGLNGEFDFIYLPKDGKVDSTNIGVAFINMRGQRSVEKVVKHFHKHVLDGFGELEVSPARVQGLEANIRHLSSLNDVEDAEWGPSVYDESGATTSIPRLESSLRPDAPEFLPRSTSVS